MSNVDPFAEFTGKQGAEPVSGDDPFAEFTGEKEGGFSAAIGASGSAPVMDTGSMNAGLEAFNASFRKLAEGGLQGMGSAVDSVNSILTKVGLQDASDEPPSLRAMVDNSIARHNQGDAARAEAYPVANAVGGAIGDVARAVPAAVATGGGSVASQVLAQAGTNAAMMAGEAADSGTQRLEKGALGFIAGGAGGYAGAKLGQGIGDIGAKLQAAKDASLVNEGGGVLSRMITPKKAATQALYNETRLAPQGTAAVLQTADDAAARGNYLSPAQAAGTKSAMTSESEAIIPTPSIKEAINVQNLGGESNIKQGLLSTVNKLLPDGYDATKAARDAAYNTLKTKSVGADDLAALDSTALRKYAGELSKSADDEIAKAPLSNAFKLNEVRKLIGKDAFNYSGGTPSEREALKQVYANMGKVLSKENVGGADFIKANDLGQKMILKNQVDDTLSKLSRDVEETPLKELNSKLFGNVEKQKDFLATVKATGGDVEATKFLIQDLQKLSIPSMDRLVAKPLGTKRVDLSGGNKVALWNKFVNGVLDGRYNKAYAKLLTENKWVPEVRELMEAKGLDRVSKLKTLLETVNKDKTATAAVTGIGNNRSRSYLNAKQ